MRKMTESEKLELCNAVARSWSIRSGRTFEECLSDCWAELPSAMACYDSAKGACPKTHLNRHLHQCCQQAAQEARRYNMRHDGDDGVLEAAPAGQSYDPRRPLWWRELIDALSPEARHVVCLLLSGPSEALDVVGGETACRIRSSVRSYLHKERGLPHHKVWNVIRELRQAVESINAF